MDILMDILTNRRANLHVNRIRQRLIHDINMDTSQHQLLSLEPHNSMGITHSLICDIETNAMNRKVVLYIHKVQDITVIILNILNQSTVKASDPLVRTRNLKSGNQWEVRRGESQS